MKKIIYISLLFITFLTTNKAAAQDTFIGQITIFAGNFPPRGWAFCDGQILQIAQNTALFSLLGTTYGGNGTTNFALPDLRGRVPVHAGSGPGLSTISLGESGGTATTTLTVAQMPAHTHSVNAVSTVGNQNLPTGNLPADTKVLDKEYSDAAANTTMSATMVNTAGSGQPINNMQPYLGLNYIIALQGIFPTRI